MKILRIIAFVLLLILVVLTALVVAMPERSDIRQIKDEAQTGEHVASTADLVAEFAPLVFAGKESAGKESASENVIIDTLNLVHWLRRGARETPRITICDIVSAIEETAPTLKERYPGRVVYVTKDREADVGADVRAWLRGIYQGVSKRCGVYIHDVEKLPDDVSSSTSPHSSLGRDDFYIAMMAKQYRCSVLSRDKYRDLDDMKRGELGRFHVYTYSPFKDTPERDFVNPSAPEFARMRRPRTIDYADVLPCL